LLFFSTGGAAAKGSSGAATVAPAGATDPKDLLVDAVDVVVAVVVVGSGLSQVAIRVEATQQRRQWLTRIASAGS
jgi:hypothetical protein